MNRLILVLLGVVLYEPAVAQWAFIPAPSYMVLGMYIEGVASCEKQYPEFKGATDSLIANVHSEIPGMLKHEMSVKVEDNAEGTHRKTLEECKVIYDISKTKLISEVRPIYLEEKAEHENQGVIEKRWLYWLDQARIPCLGLNYDLRKTNEEDAKPWASKHGSFIVSEIQPGSPASKAGLLIGDKIISIDGRNLVRESDLLASLYSMQPGDSAVLSVGRNTNIIELKIGIGARRLALPEDFTCRDASS